VEGFEHLVKVALESENLIVSSNLKFPVAKKTKKKGGREIQTHGYEIDLVGARSDLLVLASVKSFFGSRGVNRQGFEGIADRDRKTYFGLYKLFNDSEVRRGVVAKAAERFGYRVDQIELRLYVGKFQNEKERQAISDHLGRILAGRGPIKVIALNEIIAALLGVIESKTYFNDPVVITLKALQHAKLLEDRTP
jgi:hypothetical protein